MIDEDTMDDFIRYLAARADQPFGDVEMISGRTLQPFSIAGQQAARNLLDKAIRALEARDVDRARRLVDRAARLPFDDHERMAPAAIEARMSLFIVITDTLEDAPEEDSRWLDAALQVLSTADEWSQGEIRVLLAEILQDFELTPQESARVRKALRGAPEHQGLMDQELPPDQLAERVVGLLVQYREYQRVLGALLA